MAEYTTITVEYGWQERIATVTLRRPEVHNAFNGRMIKELSEAFLILHGNDHLHAVVLTGEGSSFSAGADIKMMRETVTFTANENVGEARRLAALLQSIESCPCPVLARVNGTAMGGGLGLVAACDIAIASEKARFAFSEVKLGIAPAVISPYVLRKIGVGNARALFVTGERFSAQRALAIGLLHGVVAPEHLDEAIQNALQELLTSAPQALRACKELARTVGALSPEAALQTTSQLIARLRVSDEGQEGLCAFLEKRQPNWIL